MSDKMRVYINGQLIAPELIVSVDADAGEVTVVVPIIKRHVGEGPEYVPALQQAIERKPGSWEAPFYTVTLRGEITVKGPESE